uniref:GHKL domain-containing protein n=1 Tax=Clostridium sp. E02 TaxID=2487134 RepID=UPI000F546EB5
FMLCSISLLILHFTTINFTPDNQMTVINLINVLILLALNHFLLITFKSLAEYDLIKFNYRELTMVSNFYNERIAEKFKISELKHDLKKILYSIFLMAKNNDINGIIQVVTEHTDIMDCKKVISNTGIKEIDSIINYFASKIDGEIELQYSVIINELLNINSNDCIVLIGNLLDNAIEALTNVENNQKKIISIKISLDRNIFHVAIENTYNGILNFDKYGSLLSTKNEVYNHGYGLKSIEKIVQKYNGICDFAPKTSDIFISSVMLYQSVTRE